VAPPWPSYTGKSTYVGTSLDGRLDVFVDVSLGPAATQNAVDLVADSDRIMAANDALFGVKGGKVAVIVFALGGATDGTGGADHGGCDFQTGAAIEVCASYGQSMRCSALFEAELSECSMGNNLCGESTGEALSRWCASYVSNNALSDFATAPIWDADGRPNFVDQVDDTDGNPDSTGCGMAFVSWLLSMGYLLSDVAEELVGLGDGAPWCEVYSGLTGDDGANAWNKFLAAVQALPGGVQTDDPFAGVTSPAPGPQPSPGPAPGPSPSPAGPTLDQAIQWAAQGAATGLMNNWPAGASDNPKIPVTAASKTMASGARQPYRG
jgi:hypothetical protein